MTRNPPELLVILEQCRDALSELAAEHRQLLGSNEIPETSALLTAECTVEQVSALLPPRPARRRRSETVQRLQRFIAELLSR